MTEQRLMSRAEAATYCGLTPSAFSHWVSIRRLPQALPGTRRWDRRAIDEALDRLSPEPEAAKNALDEFLERRAA